MCRDGSEVGNKSLVQENEHRTRWLIHKCRLGGGWNGTDIKPLTIATSNSLQN